MSSPNRFHSHALRRGRHSATDHIYLLTVVVEQRLPVFTDFAVGRLLVSEMRAITQAGVVESIAWVVMPDHFHWLVVLQEGELAGLMKQIKGRSALAINRATGRTGRLWQVGYHDHALRSEEDVRAVARYVVANPLRARLVKTLAEYPLWDAVWV